MAISYHPDTIEVDAYRDARRRLEGKQFSASAQFKRTYRDDPVAFVFDCFNFPNGNKPTTYQERDLALLSQHPRLAIRSPRGGGKTTFASWLVHHFILTRDDCKIPTAASSWRQLTYYLWPEIHKWAALLRWDIVGRDPYSRDELLEQMIKLSPTQRAYAMTSDKAETLEGGHAPSVFGLFDESKIIHNSMWDSMEGTFSTPGERFFLAISTPGPPVGRFYDIHTRKPGFEDWYPIHWTCDELMAANMMDPGWAEQRLKQWGENSAIYQRDVLGNFAADEEQALIPLSWVEAAHERWHGWKNKSSKIPDGVPLRVGIDTAAGGGDLTSIVPRYDNLVPLVEYMNVKNTMAIVARAGGVMDGAKGGKVKRIVQGYIEIIGHGGKGVHDRLVEREYPVSAVNVSVPTDLKDISGLYGFVNTRSALWWAVREWLDPDQGSKAMLPPDDRLTGDLTSPTWEPTSAGKIKIEPKDKTRGRLGRSPDAGDALCMTFAPEDIKAALVGSDDEDTSKKSERVRTRLWH